MEGKEINLVLSRREAMILLAILGYCITINSFMLESDSMPSASENHNTRLVSWCDKFYARLTRCLFPAIFK